jgi:hypothetical protein
MTKFTRLMEQPLVSCQRKEAFISAAEVEYTSVQGDTTRTNIVSDTKVVITFNMNEPANRSAVGFVHTLIHEIMHPLAPDVDFGRYWPDHASVIPWTNEAFKSLFGSSVSTVIPLPKSQEEEVADTEIQSLVDGHIEAGFSQAEAVALALSLNTMFGSEYWGFTKPEFVPSPYPRPRNLEEF